MGEQHDVELRRGPDDRRDRAAAWQQGPLQAVRARERERITRGRELLELPLAGPRRVAGALGIDVDRVVVPERDGQRRDLALLLLAPTLAGLDERVGDPPADHVEARIPAHRGLEHVADPSAVGHAREHDRQRIVEPAAVAREQQVAAALEQLGAVDLVADPMEPLHGAEQGRVPAVLERVVPGQPAVVVGPEQRASEPQRSGDQQTRDLAGEHPRDQQQRA